MNETKVSFVIPTFNKVSSLGYAIESILLQKALKWELIVIDDGSTDETSKEVKKFLSDDRIKYYYQENQGVSVARNRGASLAKGEYLIFLDSDDIFLSDLTSELKNVNFENYDLIFWQVKKIVNGVVSVSKPRKLGKLYNDLTGTFLAGSVCYKTSLFQQAGGYDPKITFGENYELGLRISQQENLKIKYIDQPFLQYTINTENRSSNSISNRLGSSIYQYKKHKKVYELDPKANAEMNYIIGYTLEKSNKRSAALKMYKNALCCMPWKVKPVLKVIYLTLFR